MLPDNTRNGISDGEGQKNSVRKTYCERCKKYFVGLSAFDAHIKGNPQRFRCYTTDEMRTNGFDSEIRLVKMYFDGKPIKEEHDVWFLARERERARVAFGNKAEEEDDEEEADDE